MNFRSELPTRGGTSESSREREMCSYARVERESVYFANNEPKECIFQVRASERTFCRADVIPEEKEESCFV